MVNVEPAGKIIQIEGESVDGNFVLIHLFSEDTIIDLECKRPSAIVLQFKIDVGYGRVGVELYQLLSISVSGR